MTSEFHTTFEQVEKTRSFKSSRRENKHMQQAIETYTRARNAQVKVRNLTITQRLKFIENLKQEILKHQESLIDSVQKDTRKSRTDALMSEIYPILDHLDYLLKNAEGVLADQKVKTPIAMLGKKSKVFFEPLGTILVISPWNYPLYQAIVPCTSAFVTGNAVVYKPSEHTPLKNVCEDIFKKAGFESDWIQVVYGEGNVAEALIEQKPEKIFFTGSVQTGKKIMAQASKYLIPVELELGGKDPMVVFEDANIQRAVGGAVWGAMTNSGQSCTSVERLYVHNSIYDEFKLQLVREIERVTQKVDRDGSSDIGSMTTAFQVNVIAQQLKQALSEGANQLTGLSWDLKNPDIPPIVLDGVQSTMDIMQEESFGPIVCLVPFETEEEVVFLANQSKYGLSASVWSADIKRAERVSRQIVTGNVSINNVMLSEGNHALPFGGVKQSGFGRFKGSFGLHAFSNIKSVLLDQNSKKLEANWYPYTSKKYQLFTKMMHGLFSKGISNFIQFLIYGLKLESYSQKQAKLDRDQEGK